MRFRKNINSILSFSVGALLAASSSHAKLVDVVNLANSVGTGFDMADPQQVAAALMMIDLYDQGLAGDKTGLCVDFDQTNGRPSVKIGFSTSAFVTGASQLKDTKLDFDSSRLKKLVEVIAKAQGGKVNASVAGYADGQHYGAAQGIEQSIERNKDLSQKRATEIASLLDDQFVNVTSAKGYASPDLERDERFNKPGKGLNCPTRRKVVITLDAPDGKLQEVVSPVRKFAPDSMQTDLKIKARTALQRDIRNMNRQYPNGSVRSRTDQIYNELRRRGRLVAGCDQTPLKELTQAFIASTIDNDSRKSVDDWVKSYVNDRNYKAQTANGAGIGSMIFACLRPDGEWLNELQEKHPDFVMNGKEFFGLAAGSNVKGTATVQFDAGRLHQDRVLKGEFGGTTQKGYFCRTCGAGLFFQGPDDHGHFKPKYVDRAVKANDEAHDVTKILNQLEDSDPFSFGAFLKPRLYVIKGCKDCGCDPMKRVEMKDPSVVKVDPLKEVDAVQMNSNELDNVCVIRPPLLHTCSSLQNEQSDEGEAKVGRLFQYTDLNGVQRTASSINELLNNSNPVCEDARKLSPAEKITRVACSGDSSRKLPSQNEKADCAEFIKGH